jgi:hypothetical protein
VRGGSGSLRGGTERWRRDQMLECCIIVMGGRCNAGVRGSGSGPRSTFVV